jgi:epoxide hydrolase-like predicted phosphatase
MDRFFGFNAAIAVSICIAQFSVVAMESVHNKYKNIIFDIGGVLLRGDGKYFAEKLFEGDKARAYAALPKLPVWSNWDKGKCTRQELIDTLSSSCSLDKDEVCTFIATYLGSDRSLIGECCELVKKLKSLGFKLYVLSNFSRDAYHAFVTGCYKVLFDEFDGHLFSFEVGCAKPDTHIYTLLLERYNLKAEECLFVDDTEVNVAAGKELGIGGIVYKEGQLKAALQNQGISCDE